MRDIFISHSSKDKPTLVRKLAEALRALSLNVWLDEDVILSGDNILEQIEKGIENSISVALILTPAFFKATGLPWKLDWQEHAKKVAVSSRYCLASQ